MGGLVTRNGRIPIQSSEKRKRTRREKKKKCIIKKTLYNLDAIHDHKM